MTTFFWVAILQRHGNLTTAVTQPWRVFVQLSGHWNPVLPLKKLTLSPAQVDLLHILSEYDMLQYIFILKDIHFFFSF